MYCSHCGNPISQEGDICTNRCPYLPEQQSKCAVDVQSQADKALMMIANILMLVFSIFAIFMNIIDFAYRDNDIFYYGVFELILAALTVGANIYGLVNAVHARKIIAIASILCIFRVIILLIAMMM